MKKIELEMFATRLPKGLPKKVLLFCIKNDKTVQQVTETALLKEMGVYHGSQSKTSRAR